MASELIVAELLCTRLCHDLTGPIGAVNNGVEFLTEEEPGMQGQATDLIMSSAQEAVSRLQFYRYAYGKINDGAETVLTDKKKLIADFFAGGKITLDWKELNTTGTPVTLSGAATRLLFNMLIIASATLLKGGTLTIGVNCSEGERHIGVTAAGPLVKWEKEAQDVFDGKTKLDALTPKTVQFYLTHSLAKQIKAPLAIDATENSVSFAVTESAMCEA